MLTALCAFNTINVRIVYLKNSAYISPLSQNYIMCGYKSGWVRVFSEVSKGKQKQKKPNTDFFFVKSGVLLTEQRLETTPVLSIKMRTPPPVFKVSSLSPPKEDEDITILFEGKKVVSIDGQSLWLVLRICDGQRESGIDASRMHTAFQYKKWELQHQDQVKDVVSLGNGNLSYKFIMRLLNKMSLLN